MSGFKRSPSKKGGAPRKNLKASEKEYCRLIVYDKLGAIEAARKAFGWPCEPKDSFSRKAVALRRSTRCVEYIEWLKAQMSREITAKQILTDTSVVEWDNLRQFIYRRLEQTRDDVRVAGRVRLNAINALEKLIDPGSDINLIMMWVDLVWRAGVAHCPCCHKTSPLRKINNAHLNTWRKEQGADPEAQPEGIYERRKEILLRADNRKEPHVGQILGLNAPERNIAGLGPARSGKSFLLGQFALLSFLIPGVEVWILARVYADASSEVEYLDKFLNTLFYPYTKHIIHKRYDKKTEELTLESKWGSLLKIKSAQAKGSITGRELELALIAEPGWVPDDIFNHLRARMSSRLGRTILLGTPQGFGGILGRFVNMTRRDENGRMRRIAPEKRTIAAGCPWNTSLLKYSMDPSQNPEYVQSELEAARGELTDSEYASEFQGLMSSVEGSLFAQIQPKHLAKINVDYYENCAWILGVDQGPKNFAACLLGYDGQRVVASQEYFDDSAYTMKNKMKILMESVPSWIKKLGGQPDMWAMTIFDIDPSIFNELGELEDDGMPWPTDYTFRVKNKNGQYNQENWRKETYQFVNSMAQPMDPDLLFDIDHCDLLHDELMRVQARPENRDSDTGSGSRKGWIINDRFRGDHVMDAFVMGMFTVLSDQVRMPEPSSKTGDPFEEQKAAFNYQRAMDERNDLSGYDGRGKVNEGEVFQASFGRKRQSPKLGGKNWHYQDY